MVLRADEAQCVGTGVCAQLAPSLFEVTDEGHVRILDSMPEGPALEATEAAVRQCPTRTLSIG
jgi:ferredoxin